MFGRYAIVLALAMLLVVGVCASALAQNAEDDIAAINEVWNQWTLACNTGNVELLMSLMDDNMVQMGPGAPANIGTEAIRPGEEALLGLFDIELPPMFVEEVEVAGDWGFSRLTFTLSLTPKEGGETSTSSGKALSIFKRQADGSWKVYIDCYNFDAPPPAAKLAGTSWGPGLAKMAQEDDIAAIEEVWNQYGIATTSGDLELYVSLWDDSGISMGPDAPATIGIEQIRASMEGFFALLNLEGIPIVVEEAEVAGDWAFTRVAFRISVTPKGEPEASPRSGKALSILKRQADGSWKVYIDCWNYDVPPAITSVEATSWGQVKSLFK